MKCLAVAGFVMLMSTAAEAQSPSGDRPCSVATLDTARYAAGTIFRDCDVDRPAQLKRAPRPRFEFPPGIQCAVIELEFGVDEEGRPMEETAIVMSSNAPEFARVMLRSLVAWRYEPATHRGVAVRQAVTARVARKDDRRPFVVRQANDRRPPAAPEPPCK